MNEQIARTIRGLSNVDDILRFEANAQRRNNFTPEIQEALRLQARVTLRTYVADQTGLDLSELSAAEEKVLAAVCDYIVIKKRRGTNANYTLKQLRNHGLLGAAEAAVSQSAPTPGFNTLAEESLTDISYEKIVLDHAEEFSPKAIWYSRRTLGQPNEMTKAPSDKAGKVQERTQRLLDWLSARAAATYGRISPYSNAQAAEAMGIGDMHRYGRAHGNIQSRLDYACLLANLPPLGLTAEAPFSRAWQTNDEAWSFPVESMQAAAQSRAWSTADFQRISSEVEALPGQAYFLWRSAMDEERKVKAWAFGLKAEEQPSPEPAVEVEAPPSEPATGRNPPWSRDELILALDLYLRNRRSPPGKDSEEVIELSNFLNKLGQVLRTATSDTYRNANGVYMKMMNFRRFDPEVIADGRTGLQRGNGDKERVWEEFAGDRERLSAVAASIRSTTAAHTDDSEHLRDEEPEIQEAPEGRILTRLHRTRERSGKLVSAKKRLALSRHGKLSCEACGFLFPDVYGPGTLEIIDCHHIRPVHTMGQNDSTHLDDLALICANCHRVVHSTRPWLSMDQLLDLLRFGQSTGAKD